MNSQPMRKNWDNFHYCTWQKSYNAIFLFEKLTILEPNFLLHGMTGVRILQIPLFWSLDFVHEIFCLPDICQTEKK